MQCFPVGMPDGGRDATAGDTSENDSIIFQVKFARDPSTISDKYEWVKKAIEGEVTKVRRLAERGARKYYLVTNLPATSHLESGTIDKVNSFAKEVLSIPFQCLWRDDLDRRLDGEFDLKLRFPHLLTGPDLLRLIWDRASDTHILSEARATIETYLRNQFEADEFLRFKQVDMLSTKLFDLYIDVPAVPSPRKRGAPRFSQTYVDTVTRIGRALRRLEPEEAAIQAYRRVSEGIGASGLFADMIHLTQVPQVVIEGAPGQGKTTLTQYLSQIQRARYLGKLEALAQLPKTHTSGPIFLPIKLELRDIAVWLKGVDPWNRDTDARHGQTESLESAIAGHIRRYSGGRQFSVEHVHSLMQSIPILLCLDALDEVADLDDRKRVVEEVEAAITRLSGTPGNLVVIVTSRPTALSNAPTFSPEKFQYYSLASIDPNLAFQYARKWSTARGIREDVRAEIDSILRTKLQSPHMAELAKNTMQLTILLTLISSRGSSLPDKRTELYTAYLEQFLSRESDKDPSVREHRDLLMELHGYLGYYLHANAEGNRSSGRISNENLRQLLVDYLEREEQDTSIVDKIFKAVVERVVALVSRVEGTLEFEVQPLREYFAGHYLYHTAPYSPPGRERKGTKPDRFDGIANNPYWLNVTRFYAGFFSKGELFDLAHRVCDLLEQSERDGVTYPRRLALSLLQDWVFSQSPKAARMVVDALFTKQGMAWAASVIRNPVIDMFENSSFYLPVGSGGADRAQEILQSEIVRHLSTDRLEPLCALLESVSEPESLRRFVDGNPSFREGNGRKDARWVLIRGLLSANDTDSMERFEEVVGKLNRIELAKLLRVMTLSYAESMDGMQAGAWREAMCRILDLGTIRPPSMHPDCPSALLLLRAHPTVWIDDLRHGRSATRMFGSRLSGEASSRDLNEGGRRALEIFTEIEEYLDGGMARTSLAPWVHCVDTLEREFGRSWSTITISCEAAAIVSPKERAKGVTSLFDEDASLPKRFRMIRWKGNDAQWWANEYEQCSTIADRRIWLTGVCVWTSPDVFAQLLPRIEDALAALDSSDAWILLNTMNSAYSYSKLLSKRLQTHQVLTSLRGRSVAVLLLTIRRSDKATQLQIIDDFFSDYVQDGIVAHEILPLVGDRFLFDGESNLMDLETLKACARFGSLLPYGGWEFGVDRRKLRKIPARTILENSDILPLSIVGPAFDAVDYAAPKAKAVLRIANQESWFK
ncbi:hypothetical protein GCM10017566_67690 [Amycolatopsis bartoniae]|uniref:NACHT domain-containing protein n=1 Tax=Amycolatopsis bartoniae TaxID=941986 RepID=A0A8H9J2Q7_9PSEU|nr:hypothetical protein GCM10017566_67690 [Amycolatopsis bartoniae]